MPIAPLAACRAPRCPNRADDRGWCLQHAPPATLDDSHFGSGGERGGSVVHLVGAPASGKTWLRRQLAAALRVPSYGIDEERVRLLLPGEYWPRQDVLAWERLRAALARHPACLVETSGRSPNDAVLLRGWRVCRICCVAPAPVRAFRLRERVHRGYRLAQGQADYVARVLRVPAPSLPAAIMWHSEGEGESEGAPTGRERLAAVIAHVRVFLDGGPAGDDKMSMIPT